MKRLHLIDKTNQTPLKHIYERKAVRAVIMKDQKLAMIQSDAFHEVKFPGGGMNTEESLIETLIRETKEEAGLNIIESSIHPLGFIEEKRISTVEEDTRFQMTSYYFMCDVTDERSKTNLDAYEEAYGYKLIYITIEDAIKENEKALKLYDQEAPWIRRELWMLNYLKNQKA